MKSFNKEKIVFFILLFIFGFCYRLTDYPPNFTPISGLALFSGFYFKNKYFIFLPLTVMIVSDMFIGFYQWQIMFSVYLSIILISSIGLFIDREMLFGKLFLGSFLGACLFFLITNFTVWYFSSWYSNDLNGLIKSFYMAIPFFRNTLLGDLFFTGLIFASYEIYLMYTKKILLINNPQYVKK